MSVFELHWFPAMLLPVCARSAVTFEYFILLRLSWIRIALKASCITNHGGTQWITINFKGCLHPGSSFLSRHPWTGLKTNHGYAKIALNFGKETFVSHADDLSPKTWSLLICYYKTWCHLSFHPTVQISHLIRLCINKLFYNLLKLFSGHYPWE